MLLRSLLVAAALAALAAAPASAAPVLDDLKPATSRRRKNSASSCWSTAAASAPNKIVEIYIDEIAALETPPITNFDGTLRGSVRAPFIEEGERAFSLRVTERDNLANSVTKFSRVTRLSVEQTPARAATRDRVRFRGRGFTELSRRSTPTTSSPASRRRPSGSACRPAPAGLFSIKRQQFPFKNSPRRGVWTIQFDQERAYNPKAAVNFRLTVRVRKRIKPERARAR